MVVTTRTSVDEFETIYAAAAGDAAQIPWARGRPHPALVNWLNAVAPSIVRCGARVAVVGCGLGDDARELLRRGYDVTAFDVSPSAIAWARRIDPDCEASFHEADLFAPPPRWRHRFDLVVEVHTIQALTPERRDETMRAITDLAAPRGHVLIICRASDVPSALAGGPPWPLTGEELLATAGSAGLVLDGPLASFLDEESDPPIPRIRALFRRA
jgi:SAM-dependent methyltransferase